MDLITNRGDIFREVRSRVNIIDIASRLQINLTKQGSDLIGECPVGHASKSKKSFHIVTSQREPYFHCFSCGLGGDAIRLVSITKRISDLEAAKWLIDEFKLKIDISQHRNYPKPTPEEIRLKAELISRSIFLEKIVEIGRQKLYEEEGKEALQYLVKDRGYDEDALKRTEWFYLPTLASIKEDVVTQYPEMKDTMGKSKLLGYFGDHFRLAFPYRSAEGLITGFLKRATDPKGISLKTFDKKEHDNVRWDSTPGLKKDDLFGLDKINVSADTIIVVEGYPDAIYLQALGMKNIAAVGQGKLGKKHLDGLRNRKVKNIIVAFDNDDVGPGNTQEAVKLILENSNISPYVIDPIKYGDKHKDPDEYLKANGLDALRDIFNKEPEHGVIWIVKGLLRNIVGDNPLEKKKAKDEIIELLAKVSDESVIEEVRLEISSIADETKAAFLKLVKSKRKVDTEASVRQLTEQPIVPFLDMNSNTRCYYNRMEDKLNLGVEENFIEEVMLNYDLFAPKKYPAFKVEFNPTDLKEKFDIKNKCFNLFTPTEYMYLIKTSEKIEFSTACPRTFELLKNLIPEDNERVHFINWLSYIFTTRKKARTSWVFKGAPGSGKNLFFDHLIKPLFGSNQTMVVDDDRLQSDFNGFMMNKLFVAFNEVANDETKSKRSVKSKIKALITDNKIIINEKHVKIYEIDNFANILFFSNEEIPILIEEGDRRFNVVQTGDRLKDVNSFKVNPEIFIKSLEDELPKFAQFLLNYNCDEYVVDEVIENNAKQQIKELSMNRFELFAYKLKAKNWKWFDENYPKAGDNFFGKDNRKGLMTKSELLSGKILREKVLNSYNVINDGWTSITKLTRQFKLCGVLVERKKHNNSPDEYFYKW
ncbi:MAG: toprim domain-containing protein [Ignavibacteriae bacterium]|nr:toprim domain-containing protein [Ignavibacteriota bacterium]NOH00370.1 toprim domain-containing protein [Ignavibacteriota bacterium]